jgi:hypothetical protein
MPSARKERIGYSISVAAAAERKAVIVNIAPWCFAHLEVMGST